MWMKGGFSKEAVWGSGQSCTGSGETCVLAKAPSSLVGLQASHHPSLDLSFPIFKVRELYKSTFSPVAQ